MTRSSPFDLPLSMALKHAVLHLSEQSFGSVAANPNLEELRRKLALPSGDTCMDATQVVEELVNEVKGEIIDGAEIVWAPQINQGLVRFLSRRPEATELNKDVFFTGTTWRGRPAMRISVFDCQTSPECVTRACQSVRAVRAIAIKDFQKTSANTSPVQHETRGEL